jgi:hypothetical protein
MRPEFVQEIICLIAFESSKVSKVSFPLKALGLAMHSGHRNFGLDIGTLCAASEVSRKGQL